MTRLPYNKHPFSVGDVVHVLRIAEIIAEDKLPPQGPKWRVMSRCWENGEPMVEVSCLEGGFTREITARRCVPVSAVDQLGDVVRGDG